MRGPLSRFAAAAVTLWLVTAPALADPRKDCYERSGDVAIRACTEAIGLNPKDVESYINRAFEYSQKGELAPAVADYTKAIDIDPSRWDAYQGRAWAYLKTGKAAEGLVDAQRSLQIRPDAAQTLDT